MQQHLVFTYQFNLNHVRMLVKDVTDAQLVEQPHGLVNHPAWTLGHLASASNSLAKLHGLDSTFPADWEDRFKTGGTPSSDGTLFPGKDELLAELTAQHERVAEVVAHADAALLAKEFPNEGTRKYFPTVGDFTIYLMTAHEGSHIGQIATWRRAMGLGTAAGT